MATGVRLWQGLLHRRAILEVGLASQHFLRDGDIGVNVLDQRLFGGVVKLGTDVAQHQPLDASPIEVVGELVDDVDLGRLLLVVVVWVVADAHHHWQRLVDLVRGQVVPVVEADGVAVVALHLALGVVDLGETTPPVVDPHVQLVEAVVEVDVGGGDAELARPTTKPTDNAQVKRHRVRRRHLVGNHGFWTRHLVGGRS